MPYVATNGAAYATREDARLCDVLTCVKYGTTLHDAGTLLRPNHEHYLKTPAQMARLFAEFPLAHRQHAGGRGALRASAWAG